MHPVTVATVGVVRVVRHCRGHRGGLPPRAVDIVDISTPRYIYTQDTDLEVSLLSRCWGGVDWDLTPLFLSLLQTQYTVFQLLIKLTILKYTETTQTVVPGVAGCLPVVEVVQLQQVVELVRHGDGSDGDGALSLLSLLSLLWARQHAHSY